MFKKYPVLFGILAIVLLASSASSVVGYLFYTTYNGRYQTDVSRAQTGVQDMQKAEALLYMWSHNPFDTQLTSQAGINFASALQTFTLLNRDLNSSPQFIEQVPTYGVEFQVALHLVPLASTLSRMGVAGCDILNIFLSRLHDPLSLNGQGITLADFARITQDIQMLHGLLPIANHEIAQLQPADIQFDARIPKLVNAFHKYIPTFQVWADTLEQLLPAAPALLGIGHATSYLVEILDSTELRPGGGFIGNYGIATVFGSRLQSTSITDTYLLDRPFVAAGHTIPYPATYSWFDLAPKSWSLRDSDLDADFPTAARYAEKIYQEEGGQVAVQGVIALTPELIQRVLMITGPIYVPEYHETITSQNLIDRIHYYQLSPESTGRTPDLPSSDGYSSQRKHFIALLAQSFLARVRHLPSADLSKFLLIALHSISSKDLQIYLNSNAPENLLQRFHMDASIRSSVKDSLLVVDANIAPNKANGVLITTMNNTVTLDKQGNALHHLTLQYVWPAKSQVYGEALYSDYVRVYVPPTSVLLSQNGWQANGTSNAFNKKVFTGYLSLSSGETRTITLTWQVPIAVTKTKQGQQYQYVIQRQAGILWKQHLQIMLPQCASLTSNWSGLKSSNKQSANLIQSLQQDLYVGVVYECS